MSKATLSPDSGRILWQNGWTPIDEKHRLYLDAELRFELAANPNHLLKGRSFILTGWIPGYDDVFLELNDKREFAWVHLSWNRESRPAWPHCELFSSIEDANHFLGKWGPGNE